MFLDEFELFRVDSRPSWFSFMAICHPKRLSAPPQYQHLMEENEGKTILVRLAIIEGRTSRKLVPLIRKKPDVAGFVGEDFASSLDSSEIELEYWSLDT